MPAMSAAGRARHRPRGRDQADEQPAMLRALADRPDAGERSCAASRRRGCRDRPARPCAARGSSPGVTPAATMTRSAGESSRRRSARPDRRGSRSVMQSHAHVDALVAQRALEHAERRWRRAGVPSARPARWTTVTAMPRSASRAAASRPSRPPPMTTARRAPWVAAAERAHVVAGAEGDVRAVEARDRRHERARAGREDERVVGIRSPAVVVATSSAARRRSPRVAAQVDAALGVPAQRLQLEIARPAVPAEQLGQQDAVVRQAGLLAEHRDLPIAGVREHLLDGRQAGHAGADDRRSRRWRGSLAATRGAPAATGSTAHRDRLQLGLRGDRVDGAVGDGR